MRRLINGLGGEENGLSIKDGEVRYVYPRKVDGQELVSRCMLPQFLKLNWFG